MGAKGLIPLALGLLLMLVITQVDWCTVTSPCRGLEGWEKTSCDIQNGPSWAACEAFQWPAHRMLWVLGLILTVVGAIGVLLPARR